MPPIAKPIAERFWSRVERGAPGECWTWKGTRLPRGYGVLSHTPTQRAQGYETLAHRIAWTLADGAIPPGLHVCHSCDNPPCVNRAHLFLGTRTDNMQDAARKGRVPRGEWHSQRVLTEAKVREIRHLSDIGLSMSDTAFLADVALGAAHAVLLRETWAWL